MKQAKIVIYSIMFHQKTHSLTERLSLTDLYETRSDNGFNKVAAVLFPNRTDCLLYNKYKLHLKSGDHYMSPRHEKM